MRCPVVVALLLIATILRAESGPPPRVVEKPVQVWVESSLPTAGKNIRQLAFDGKKETRFESSKDATAGDTLTFRFDRKIPIRGVTADTSGDDHAIEVSADGQSFSAITDKTGEVTAVRLRVTKEAKAPLFVREVKFDTTANVVPFKYPVEYTIDVTDAPEMKEWVEKTVRICESQYTMICDLLTSKDYVPPTQVRLTLKKDYKGVAAAGGGRITGSVDFFKKNPDDRGAFVHETVHIVQNYRQRGLPGWLVEGIPDYIRFWIYEPGKAGRVNPDRAKYDGSYRTSASFLAFVTEKYEPTLITKLNAALREGTYEVGVWKKLTGKTVEELNDEWKASLRK